MSLTTTEQYTRFQNREADSYDADLKARRVLKVSPAIRVDEADSVTTYVGYAEPGSASSAAEWRIIKIDTTSGTIITYADGDDNYDNVWDNRASLTYS